MAGGDCSEKPERGKGGQEDGECGLTIHDAMGGMHRRETHERAGCPENRNLRLSAGGLEMIKRYEHLKLTEYKDFGGEMAIGYGHHLRPGENFSHGITEAKANQLLRGDVRNAELQVKELVKVPLTQPQFDALVSFCYNIGQTRFEHSELLKKVNRDDFVGAGQEFHHWVAGHGHSHGHAHVLAGLIARRKEERAMFLSVEP